MEHLRIVRLTLAVIINAGGTVNLTDQQFEKLLNIFMKLRLPESIVDKILCWGENIPALLASGVSPMNLFADFYCSTFIINDDAQIQQAWIVEYRKRFA